MARSTTSKGKPQPDKFSFRTGDVAALNNLMYGLDDLVKNLRLTITPEGIRIGESVCQDNLFIFASFQAERFLSYETNAEKITICVDPKHMQKILKSHQQRDILTCSYTSAREHVINFKLFTNGSEEIVQEYEIALLKADDTEFAAPKKEVDYLLAFNSGMLSNLLSGLNSMENDFIDTWITISCAPEMVEFKLEGGCIVTDALIRFNTATSTIEFDVSRTREDGTVARERRRSSLADKDKDSAADADAAAASKGRTKPVRPRQLDSSNAKDIERTKHQELVTHQYRLRYLNQLLKCFSITRADRGLFMYVSKDFPLVFEVKVGSLGDLRAALMFRDTSMDSDEEMFL